MDELSRVYEFGKLEIGLRKKVAAEIRRQNKLKIGQGALRERIEENILILRFNKVGGFVCLGIKAPSQKSLIWLESVKPRQGCRKKLEQLRVCASKSKIFERGWATNCTGIKGAIGSLEDEFDRRLKKLGLTRANTFATVVDKNISAIKSIERSGYGHLGTERSPYSSNRLRLYGWP